jgi:hypothetical protein
MITLTPEQQQEAMSILYHIRDDECGYWDNITHTLQCAICERSIGPNNHHAPDCPVARAVALLAALEKEDE